MMTEEKGKGKGKGKMLVPGAGAGAEPSSCRPPRASLDSAARINGHPASYNLRPDSSDVRIAALGFLRILTRVFTMASEVRC